MSSSSIVQPLLGGIQATVSVILTISFGVAFSQFGLLDADAASKISKTSVKVLLPCLLINNLGSQLKPETAYEYVPIISRFLPNDGFMKNSTYCKASLGDHL
jgi:predicted permease